MFKEIAVTGSLLILVSGASAMAVAQSMADCPMHAQHMAQQQAATDAAAKEADAAHAHGTADGSAGHGAEVDSRHDQFGMAHQATRHSFRLFADGGAIELRANSEDDKTTIEMIRKHLQEVCAQFTTGNFTTPAFVHGTAPDGVGAMQKAGDAIVYRFEPLPAGGRIRMTTKSPGALQAVHEFLGFQVVEHRTGDSGKVEPDR